jgi:hypothetical protein
MRWPASYWWGVTEEVTLATRGRSSSFVCLVCLADDHTGLKYNELDVD